MIKPETKETLKDAADTVLKANENFRQALTNVAAELTDPQQLKEATDLIGQFAEVIAPMDIAMTKFRNNMK